MADQSLADQLRALAMRYNEGRTWCGQQFDGVMLPEYNVPHCSRCRITEEDHVALESATRLDALAQEKAAAELVGRSYKSSWDSAEADLAACRQALTEAQRQRNQLANFNPDWDMLKATQESLREHMALLKAAEAERDRLRGQLAAAEKRIESLCQAHEIQFIRADKLDARLDAIATTGGKATMETKR